MKQKQSLEIIYEGKKITTNRSMIRQAFQKIFHTNRKHKDRLFIRLFSEPKALLQLYNAINHSDYTNPDDLIITTLEDAVYLGMKNDCSFLIGSYLNLYEHQSTFNPNMPLRGLLYYARAMQGYLAVNEIDIYSSSLVKIPTPKYIVFYNGTKDYPDAQTLNLSDAFQTPGGCAEFSALMLNINLGHNQELMKQCRTLEEYAVFIDKIREFQHIKATIEEAIDAAADYCIEHNILKTFLLKNRNEVRQLILTEYDEKKHLRIVRRDAKEEGRVEGVEHGIEAFILDNLEENVSETRIMEKLMKRFNLTENQAKDYYKKFAK
ncbi:MAG: hypothetical protein PHS82_16255 [Lachnospiraceae bacterium]|nr:hypothetical protein [Lachnospiraceae bacterium]